MRFWDSSAVVPLLLDQRRTDEAVRLRRADAEMTVWWGTVVECHSAISRLLREHDIDRGGAAQGIERLTAIAAEWTEVEPSVHVRDEACRLLRAHPLRAADALQLAAVLRLAGEFGDPVELVCFDKRLADAARLEQLTVVGDAREAR